MERINDALKLISSARKVLNKMDLNNTSSDYELVHVFEEIDILLEEAVTRLVQI